MFILLNDFIISSFISIQKNYNYFIKFSYFIMNILFYWFFGKVLRLYATQTVIDFTAWLMAGITITAATSCFRCCLLLLLFWLEER